MDEEATEGAKKVEKFTMKDALERVMEDAKDGKDSDFYKASLRLNINLKNTEQQIRLVLSYPHAIGAKKPSALIFAMPEFHELIKKYEFEVGSEASFSKVS